MTPRTPQPLFLFGSAILALSATFLAGMELGSRRTKNGAIQSAEADRKPSASLRNASDHRSGEDRSPAGGDSVSVSGGVRNRLLRLSNVLASAGAVDWLGLIRAGMEQWTSPEIEVLLAAWAEEDGSAAVEFVHNHEGPDRERRLQLVYEGWALTDPSAAMAALASNEDHAMQCLPAILATVGRSDPATAVQWLLKAPEAAAALAAPSVARAVGAPDPEALARHLHR